MDKQTNPNIMKIVAGMESAGVPGTEAVAVAMAIEHALTSAEYAAQYGTFLQGRLAAFVNKMEAS